MKSRKEAIDVEDGQEKVVVWAKRRHIFFFLKQKTAYDMLKSPVGSEMYIKDRPRGARRVTRYEVKLVGLARDYELSLIQI